MDKEILQIILSNDSKISSYLLDVLNSEDFLDIRYRLLFSVIQQSYRRYGIILSKSALELILKTFDGSELTKNALTLLYSLDGLPIKFSEIHLILTPIIRQRIKQAIVEEDNLLSLKNRIDSVWSIIKTNYATYDITDEITMKERERIPTPWNIVNNVLPESFNKGDLCILLAGINVGKTMFLCNLLRNPNFAGKKIKFVTCEDGFVKIKKRLEKILHDVDKFVRNLDAELKIVEVQSPNILLLNSIAKGADVLIIDYLDRITVAANEYRIMLKLAAESLKKIAVDNNCLVWTAKQLRRDGLKKTLVSMEDIGESFAVCESPDLILGMSVEDDMAFINIAKSRDVKLENYVTLRVDIKQQLFLEE